MHKFTYLRICTIICTPLFCTHLHIKDCIHKCNHICNSSTTLLATSHAPFCTSLRSLPSASLDAQLHHKCILFFTFLCNFKCSFKWNFRCILKCKIKCPLKFTFLLNRLVHSCALTNAAQCTSSSATQLLPQVQP